ncbi:nucleotidyltransferase domain-containing protein [Rhodopseudomonas sp. WA056]|uniref:nucleotidyltransferase family protein n=1 Tax=Rhodopseudomonas TaxID=1073 RepID=UPI00115EABEE|nr:MULTISPECIES: nucleotidyltransferase domain-containing protein [Rhodopseudomonas]NEW87965.1 nucleotidyltransferase domain-containing protein [Rhodopseudomonas sp. WA056]QDL98143.1 nucleotidyltransferase domain-containing protein [Rhodopseudomonas palustris]
MTPPMPKLDLRPEHRAMVHDILATQIPDRDVVVFGSRARGNAKPHSDLDLAVLGDDPLGLHKMAELKEAFEESDLPFKVDVVEWARTDARFREVIRRDAVRVQDGCAAAP